MSLDPLQLPEPALREAPEPRPGKRRPRLRLRSEGAETSAVADWASLHGDLARRATPSMLDAGAPIEWRVHDRTHVEFAIDYAIGPKARDHVWEAYFFVPDSFRLDAETYDKAAIYDDLWSYVRYSVPAVPLRTLASVGEGSALARVRECLRRAAGLDGSAPEAIAATRELRVFACLLRASGLSAMRDAERALPTDRRATAQFIADCAAVTASFRAVIAGAERLSLADQIDVAARWADEDISLVLETLSATLGIAVEARAPAERDLAAKLAAHAVREARHRRDRGYDSVGSSTTTERGTEHFEFRRHILKRFTASVLWLSLDVRRSGTWVVHVLYALAAGAAMTFALFANLRAPAASANFSRYALVIVLAYAGKDRLKALLQTNFAGWISSHLPDRKWSIRDGERGVVIGKVHERAAFLPFRRLPAEVLASRRQTRAHPLEEAARPERVLWHQKVVHSEALTSGAKPGTGPAFSTLTEIFRLNLHRWLRHTDDPNRKVVFADPADARVYQVTSRRVYNINVVYRLRAGDESKDTPWHRIRVVVSRKGIERIDAIS